MTSWLGRLVRGRRLDRNPLRRACDRAETVVLGALLAVFLAAAPFAAHAAGSWAYAASAREAQAQRASLSQAGRLGRRLAGDRAAMEPAALASGSIGWILSLECAVAAIITMDVPVNNPLIRSRPACAASHRMLVSGALESLIPSPRAGGLAAFPAAFP